MDLRNLTYVKFGRAIIGQPHRTAIQIIDAKTIPLLRDEYRIREVTKVCSKPSRVWRSTPGRCG
jgi:tricarballylate dehydrogenase